MFALLWTPLLHCGTHLTLGLPCCSGPLLFHCTSPRFWQTSLSLSLGDPCQGCNMVIDMSGCCLMMCPRNCYLIVTYSLNLSTMANYFLLWKVKIIIYYRTFYCMITWRYKIFLLMSKTTVFQLFAELTHEIPVFTMSHLKRNFVSTFSYMYCPLFTCSMQILIKIYHQYGGSCLVGLYKSFIKERIQWDISHCRLQIQQKIRLSSILEANFVVYMSFEGMLCTVWGWPMVPWAGGWYTICGQYRGVYLHS